MKHNLLILSLLFSCSIACLAGKNELEAAIIRSDLEAVLKPIPSDIEKGEGPLGIEDRSKEEIIDLAKYMKLNRQTSVELNKNMRRNLILQGGGFLVAGFIKSTVDIFFRNPETTEGLGGARLVVTDAITDTMILSFAGYTLYKGLATNPEVQSIRAAEIYEKLMEKLAIKNS